METNCLQRLPRLLAFLLSTRNDHPEDGWNREKKNFRRAFFFFVFRLEQDGANNFSLNFMCCWSLLFDVNFLNLTHLLASSV